MFLHGFVFVAKSQKSVLMRHNDRNGTGWYNDEHSLTVNNVKPGSFGKLFERTVDDELYAQPLVVYNVNLPSAGVHNIVIAATVNNTIYAFDADSASVSAPYWQRNLTAAGARVVRNTDMSGACGGNYLDFSGNIGIVGTPAIDTTTKTMYLVSRSVNTTSNTYMQYLHAIDITTGAEKFNGPKLITASVNGNGDGNVNGKIPFNSQKQNQRPGLLLLNGVVYIAWASHCDWPPYHGWLMGYDMTTLEQKYVYNTTPEGYNGGIWMCGAAPTADENGNIYVASGNGYVGLDVDYANPINRSHSALKLTPNGNSLTLTSFFTPNNILELEGGDLDFGVTQVMLVPGTNRAIASCKDGKIYLMDRDNMGGYNGPSNNVIQTIDLGSNSHLHSSLTYYKGQQSEFVYSWSENALLKAFPYDRTTNKFLLTNTVNGITDGPTGNSGAMLSLSSNGSVDSTAVLWAFYAATGDAGQSVRPGILRAFSAADVTKELWNTSIYQNDNPGNYAKFNCPVIANGKVYLGTFSKKLMVYGLLNGPTINNCNSVNIAANKTAIASSFTDAQHAASMALDGNTATEWTSQSGEPQSIYVDLGTRFDLCRVVLKWGSAYGKDFIIQVSDDAVNWNNLVNISGNTSVTNNLPVTGTARYVRMYGTASAGSGYSLQEFEIYGTQSSNQCAPPAGPFAGNIYENAATLHWIGNGGNKFYIEYKTASAVSWVHTTSDTNFIQLSNLACATDYLFRIKNICSVGDSSTFSTQAAFTTLQCNSNCGPLPTRWVTQDIGNVNIAGSACFDNGVFELHASGNDIWGTEDAFRIAYKTFVGDGEIKARVLSMDNSNQWNKCGIMFRESLSPGSRHAFVALTSANGAAFQNRLQTDGVSNNISSGVGISAPYWIRLDKRGSLYSAFISPDGTTWTQLGAAVDAGFGNGTPVYAGLALTSHNDNALSVATIDNYTLGGDFLQFKLQSFTASLGLNKTVDLEWTTTMETNILHFIVERSSDNVHYTPIDTVAATNSGNFAEIYESQDNNPGVINYYRIRITNADGSITYSQPVFIRVPDSAAPLLYPNPGKNTVHIVKGSESIKLINVYDITGRFITSITNAAGNAIIDMQVSSYSNGVYILEIRTGQSVYRQKLVVRN